MIGDSAPEHMNPSREYMQMLIDLISDVFFLGKLDHTSFEWVKMKGLAGLACTDPDHCSTITMDMNYWYSKYSSEARQAAVLGALFHECAHVFIHTYSCKHHQDPNNVGESCVKARGESGHGSAWVQLTSHLQARAIELLRMDINIEIEEGIDHEYEVSGQTLRAEDLGGCHRHSRRAIIRQCLDLAGYDFRK